MQVEPGELGLRTRVPLIRRELVEPCSFPLVFREPATAMRVIPAEGVLRFFVPAVSRKPIEPLGLVFVLCNPAAPTRIQSAEMERAGACP